MKKNGWPDANEIEYIVFEVENPRVFAIGTQVELDGKQLFIEQAWHTLNDGVLHNLYLLKLKEGFRSLKAYNTMPVSYTHLDVYKRQHYALAGDLRIALLRGGELIPISEGQTMDVLAVHAYEEGKISKKEAVWSMEEKRAWNYLGLDGFHEIETAERPIRLKAGDQIFLASKGIWQELSWAEIEDVLISPMNPQEKAERLAAMADRKPGSSKENGSVFIIEAEVGNETD